MSKQQTLNKFDDFKSIIKPQKSSKLPSFPKYLGKEERFESMKDAQQAHYNELSIILKNELNSKIKFRKILICFMISIISIHFVVTFIILFCHIYFKHLKITILSDTVIMALVVTSMLNYLATLGIILKYVFSSTAETYKHMENTVNTN